MKGEKLNTIKSDLKDLAAKDLEQCLNELSLAINNDSKIYNNIIGLKGRIWEVKSENNKGVINENDKTLRFNQIRSSVVEIIDQIDVFDLAGINTSKQEIKLLIDFTKEVAILESKIESIQDVNKFLKNELEEQRKKTNYYKDQLTNLQNKINNELEKPELLKGIQKFYSDYQETIDYFPRFSRIISTLAKNEFFEEKISADILKCYTRVIMRELDYYRFTISSIFDEKEFIWSQGETIPNINDFNRRLNELIFFKKTFDINVPIESIKSKLYFAQELLNDIQIRAEIGQSSEVEIKEVDEGDVLPLLASSPTTPKE